MAQHTLFDRGYVSIGGDRTVMVSPRLKRDWDNGRRYYAYDGQPLVRVPARPDAQPNPDALAWHRAHRFLD